MWRWAAALLLMLSVALSVAPAAEAAPDTFVRIIARGDATGRTEVALHKAYAGQHNRPEVSWWFQNPDSLGTGTAALNVIVEFPPGVAARPERNGVKVIRSGGEERIFERNPAGWEANRREIPSDAGAALALSIYLVMQLRRTGMRRPAAKEAEQP